MDRQYVNVSGPDAEVLDMGRAISRMDAAYGRALRLMGLNSVEAKVLFALYFADALTQREICDAYDMPKQTVNNVVKRLVADGLARSVGEDGDRRSKSISLTGAGREHADGLLTPMMEFERRVRRAMGARYYDQLIELTDLYADAIESALADGCVHRRKDTR